MAYPDSTRIDEAVPVAGTPSRALVNALLKDVVSSLGPFRRQVAIPAAMDSPGDVGDWAVDPLEGIYICVGQNDWRIIHMMGWE